MEEIGFGGSCHWCTEAIFSSLKGILNVQQGWIASDGLNQAFSEAVIVEYDPLIISLATLIEIHLYTHSCTSNHSMRSKYRSAVYTFSHEQSQFSKNIIRSLQSEFSDPIITEVLPHEDFRLNSEDFLNYYYGNPEKPFCENIVNPKLRSLMEKFKDEVDVNKLSHLSKK
ncbi:peptide-methionine (S)-S-oxide reductase [Pedobacter sp. MC2016-15]|uniref:peptide-methionine (S)-S-oxide reductase n=1 Tax=Pedobacter sp. MC2016-15 TaxID=2994473 RepID=UPI002246CF14|nr:peptide-methionine (S)-S-oxide reductase [Pedobacter sp. MC2016-15]MCX2477930.1 peptide-methionine (S)-S-oxide reductase [Pedobacter sp. MC2016-15]